MISQLKVLLLLYLSAAMVVIGVPSLGYSMTVPTEVPAGANIAGQRTADLLLIQRELESKVLSQRLVDLGLSPHEVQAKINGLTDEQLHQVAQQMEGVQTGGELILILAVVGAIVLVLAILGLLHGGGHHH